MEVVNIMATAKQKKGKTGHKTNKTMKQKRGLENQCKICLKLGKVQTACGIVHMKLHMYHLSSIVLLCHLHSLENLHKILFTRSSITYTCNCTFKSYRYV